jgi:two-component system chemotaxis response regulator CheB
MDDLKVAGRDLIVVGASAGGVDALKSLVESLPGDLPASVLIVLHLPAFSPSALPAILRRRCRLPTEPATDDQLLRKGQVYVAPPDRHLIVEDGVVRLSRGPKENGHRPSIDVLFRSAALAAGPRVIGVVLSGALDDGTAGLAAIKAVGGLAVVQEPGDALVPTMPESALRSVAVDHVVAAAVMGKLLDHLVREPVPARVATPNGLSPDEPSLVDEVHIAAMAPGEVEANPPGIPAGFGCPDCHGALFELTEGDTVHYRCRVGHAWSEQGLLEQQSEALEGALWTALRTLEEKRALSQRMAKGARDRGHDAVADRMTSTAEESGAAAQRIRELLEDLPARAQAKSDREAKVDELA